MAGPSNKLKLSLLAATFFATTIFAVAAKAQSDQEGEAEITAPLQALRSGITESQLLAEVDAHNQLRKSALQQAGRSREPEKNHEEEI